MVNGIVAKKKLRITNEYLLPFKDNSSETKNKHSFRLKIKAPPKKFCFENNPCKIIQLKTCFVDFRNSKSFQLETIFNHFQSGLIQFFIVIKNLRYYQERNFAVRITEYFDFARISIHNPPL